MNKQSIVDIPYRLICGLEIHVELKTVSKMFCPCKNDPFATPKPNIYTCPYCLGRAGVVPIPNRKAIEWTIKFGLFTKSKIQQKSYFERKHYQYPDVPKGYQISQCTRHFTYNGQIETSDGLIRLAEAHLEEDVAKLLHQSVCGEMVSLIDFNRSGVPLLEIVSMPDIHSSQQAIEYAKNVQAIVRYLGIADARMERGQMRIDANVSIQTHEQEKYGKLPSYKVEIKNINSFRFLGQAIDFEIQRQADILKRGNTPKRETRGYDSKRGITFFQRDKGVPDDFCAQICPDISKIIISDELLALWQKELPDNKAVVVKRWNATYDVPIFVGEKLAKDQEQITWWDNLFVQAQKTGIDFVKLIKYVLNRNLTSSVKDSKIVINMFKKAKKVENIDQLEIERLIDKVLIKEKKVVVEYQAGKTQVVNFLLGQIMKNLSLKPDMKIIRKILQDRLGRHNSSEGRESRARKK
jgi:aspartyl-tRNA(Asn)/glutamyl-tRNA(Gln) amidotransferase subunit B